MSENNANKAAADAKKIQDFEEGGEQTPKIVRYTNDVKPAAPQPAVTPARPSDGPKVDPTAAAPTQAQPATPAAPVQPAAPAPAVKPGIVPPNPANKRRAILGCLGAFGSLMLIFLILSFIFLAQAGKGTSPIAKLLGVNEGVFINGLITFVHVIFILISLTAFVFTMVGLFKASMARKDDKDSRKAGLRTSIIAGSALFFILIVWGFTYVYLDSKRVELSPEYSQPVITTPEETLGLTAPIEIKFDASNVPIDRNRYQIVSHDWDFGDKSDGSGQIVSHIYKEKGTYDVKLTITVKNKDTGELSVGGEYHTTVSVESLALSALFSADPQSGEAPLKVKFDASASSDPDGTIAKYEWDFTGDGKFKDATGKVVEHTFEKIGKYKVSLRVTSTTDKFNIGEKEITVEEAINPVAVINVANNPKTFTINQSYVFNADDSSSPNGKIQKYEWTFSDTPGKKEVTKTVSHIFKSPGTQEVYLKVVDEKDKDNEVKKVITVSAPMGLPKAKINTNPAFDAKTNTLSGKAPFSVTFDPKGSTDSDNNIIDYQWDFDGDGKFEEFGDVATHVYTTEGDFTVGLKVVDADKNIGTANLIVKVEAQGIVPNLQADTLEGNVPLTVNFDASASSYSKGQISSYKWDFGDGTPVKTGSAIISHKYTAIGTFTASVTIVASDNTTAKKSISINVREIPLSACFTAIVEKGPAPLNTSFDPSCSTGSITSYSWDFDDHTTSTQVKPTHTFEKTGTYNVVLEVSDAENTISKSELTITVTGDDTK